MDALDDKQRRMLGGLADKYRALRELRRDPTGLPRALAQERMRELSRRFPGALRELDELPLPILDARLQAVARVLDQGLPPEHWMTLQCAYHGGLRAALRIKPRLRTGSVAAAPDALAGYVAADDEPAASSFDHVALQAIARPPGGRLSVWVLGRVAAAHGTTADAVRAALFGC